MTTGRRAPTREEMLEAAAHRNRVVAEVLARGVARHGCPCAWERFVFWVGKEHPDRSMDELQNALVRAASKLPTFAVSPPVRPEYWLEGEWLCARCGARWKHYSEEWRMLAFRERLICSDRPAAEAAPPAPDGSGPPATPEDWAEFMLGAPLSS